MKKFVVAAMLAVAVAAGSAPRASAWGGDFDFKIGIGFSFGIKWGCNSCCAPSCYSGGCYGGYCGGDMVGPYYGPWGQYAGGGHDGGYDAGHALPYHGGDHASSYGHGAYPSAPVSAPAGGEWSAPAPKPAAGGNGVTPSVYWYGGGYQPVGYHYPSQAAPRYWYGR